jgi:hypothetical protein
MPLRSYRRAVPATRCASAFERRCPDRYLRFPESYDVSGQILEGSEPYGSEPISMCHLQGCPDAG